MIRSPWVANNFSNIQVSLKPLHTHLPAELWNRLIIRLSHLFGRPRVLTESSCCIRPSYLPTRTAKMFCKALDEVLAALLRL